MPHTGQGFPTSPSACQPTCCSLPLTSSQRSCSCRTTPLPPALGYTGTFFRMVQLEPALGGASNFSPCNGIVTVFHSRQTDGHPAPVSASALLLGVASPQTHQLSPRPQWSCCPGPAAGREQAEGAAYLLFPPAEQHSRLSQQRCLEGCPHTSCPRGCAPQSGATPSLLQQSREREKIIHILLCFLATKNVSSQPGRKPRALIAPTFSHLSAGPLSQITESTDPPPWLKRGGCSNRRSNLGAAGQLPCHEAASAPPAPAACAGRAASSDHRGPNPPKHNVPKTAEKTRAVGAGGSGQGPRHSLVNTNIALRYLRLFLPKKGCQGINARYNQKRGGEAPSSGKVSMKHQVRGGTRKQVFNTQHKHALKTRPAITSLCGLLNSFLVMLVLFLAKETHAPARARGGVVTAGSAAAVRSGDHKTKKLSHGIQTPPLPLSHRSGGELLRSPWPRWATEHCPAHASGHGGALLLFLTSPCIRLAPERIQSPA